MASTLTDLDGFQINPMQFKCETKFRFIETMLRWKSSLQTV